MTGGEEQIGGLLRGRKERKKNRPHVHQSFSLRRFSARVFPIGNSPPGAGRKLASAADKTSTFSLFGVTGPRWRERERETERGRERPSVFLSVEYVMHETLGLPDGWFVVFVQLLLSTIGRKKTPIKREQTAFLHLHNLITLVGNVMLVLYCKNEGRYHHQMTFTVNYKFSISQTTVLFVNIH